VNRAIILFGPTAAGKTALLSELQERRFEVISADSLQVYRGLDIGTAKPDPQLRSSIPHHLIDICGLDETFNVGTFCRLAQEAVRRISSAGRVPIISGGTAYYIRHFLFGMPQTPKASAAVREAVKAWHAQHGDQWCRKKLESVDPEAAAKIAPADIRRTLRALEVYEETGRPLSSFAPQRPQMRSDLDLTVIGLYREPAELRERIRRRVEAMFAEGLVEEIRGLIRSGVRTEWQSMQGIGYREFFLTRLSGEFSRSMTADMIIRNTRAYAKRQMTFFRTIEQALWLHPEEDRERLIQLLLRAAS
jgi:tRNA dimethylallyltransferase